MQFQVGDKVQRKSGSDLAERIISWVSKCGELIATEYNGYCNPCDWADGYKKVA